MKCDKTSTFDEVTKTNNFVRVGYRLVVAHFFEDASLQVFYFRKSTILVDDGGIQIVSSSFGSEGNAH